MGHVSNITISLFLFCFINQELNIVFGKVPVSLTDEEALRFSRGNNGIMFSFLFYLQIFLNRVILTNEFFFF